MNILAVHGGTHLNGNTATLMEAWCKGALDKGHTVKRLDVASMEINPCVACDYCRPEGRGSGLCVKKDEMPYDDIKHAQALVLASPVFWWGFTAQLKAFIDRIYALPFNVWRGKKVKIILTSDYPIPNMGGQTQHAIWGHMASYLKYEFLGVLEASSREQKIAQQTDLLQRAYLEGYSL